MNSKDKDVSLFTNIRTNYVVLSAEVKGVIAFLLMFILFLLAMIILSPLFLEKNCWVLEAKEHRLFKVNSCNGEVIEITEEYREKAKSFSEK